jgi:predicted metal-binding membrane protein
MTPVASPASHRARIFFPARASDVSFLSASALLFAAGTAVTIAWCASMSAMSETICGAMSMFIPMPGQTWLGAAASFLGMWIVMMIAMMLPSLVPMLRRYRAAIGDAPHLGRLTATAGAGYFLVWTLVGIVVFPFGAALAVTATALPALILPVASGVVVMVVGALQFTAWKARRLARCHVAPSRLPADTGMAWRHGLRLGVTCCIACANLMAILLVLGVMDLAVMAIVTAAITAERLLPAGERVARLTGAVAIATGLFLIARSTGFV